jgi:hypothetical protein
MGHDHVKIQLDEWGKGEVLINGQPLKSSLAIRLVAHGGNMTWVTICMLASVEYEGPAQVELTEDPAMAESIRAEVEEPVPDGS